MTADNTRPPDLTAYGRARLEQVLDVLTTLHGELHDQRLVDGLGDLLDILHGHCLSELHNRVIDAANAPVRDEFGHAYRR